jgi:hypothetical protein
MISAWLKRHAIRRYMSRLPRRLFQDYGHAGPYTPAQIEATMRRHRIGPQRHAAYAVAIFCDPKRLPEFQPDHGPNYRALREEVGDAFFEGDSGFTVRDVGGYGGAPESSGHGGGEHSGGHHGDGGGHH